ncbi:hypothetical protein CsSME_00038039 [Camellia sinensis var. sinensis]
MNVQVHMSGQISGQVPNQAGTQLPGLPPQNGSSLSNHIQNLAGQCNTLNMEPELAKARRFMQEKIYDFLMQRQQQTNDIPPKRVLEIVRRLDEGLFRNAATKEEYVNLETLENRLRVVIESLPMSTHNQKYPHLVNAPSPIEPELAKARRFMLEKIYDFLMQRQQRTNDIPPKRVLEIVRRLDEGLFRNAATKEEYLNLETLENRLHVLIKRLPMSTHNQQYPRLVNAPSPIGTMIPTPDSANSSVMVASAVDTSMIATGGGNSMPSVAVNTGSLLPPANGSSVGIHGGSFNSQVPANFLHEQNIQEEFHQRIAVQDEAQLSRIFKRHSIRE